MSGDRGLLCCARMMTGHSSGWLEKTPESDVAEQLVRDWVSAGVWDGGAGSASSWVPAPRAE